MNIIENSRKGAATDSAYGYKDAVNKAYVQELAKPNQGSLKLNGTYEVQSDGSLKPATGSTFGIATANYVLPVSVSGDKPSSGTLTYDNNVLTSGTLIIGDYTVTYSNGAFTAVKTSIASNEPVEEPAQGGGEGCGTSSNSYLTTFNGNYTYYALSDYLYEEPLITDATYDDEDGHYYCEDDSYSDDYDEEICYKCPDYFSYDGSECVGHGSVEIQDVSDVDYYIRDDGEIKEVCGVFSGGTVCMTSANYNNDYSTAGNYECNFEDVGGITNNIKTTSELASTGLKGYSLAKTQEMIDKGAFSCRVYNSNGTCKTSNNSQFIIDCGVNHFGRVYCTDDSGHVCGVDEDGSYYCH